VKVFANFFILDARLKKKLCTANFCTNMIVQRGTIISAQKIFSLFSLLSYIVYEGRPPPRG
jgi:hypothetical protein